MRGKIIKVSKARTQNGINYLIDVRLETGKVGHVWIVEDEPDFAKWLPIAKAEVGTPLSGLEMKRLSEIDPASKVRVG